MLLRVRLVQPVKGSLAATGHTKVAGVAVRRVLV
jgi:hypothetical protein